MAYQRSCNLNFMPFDIQHEIVSYLNKRDAAALCATCKNIGFATKSRLYRKLHLQLGGPEDEPYQASLNPSHSGLEFIKELTIDYAHVSVETGVQENTYYEDAHDPLNWRRDIQAHRNPSNKKEKLRAFQYLDTLFSVLPQHSLRKFYWTRLWTNLPVELWIKLHQTQRNLENIECLMLEAESLEAYHDLLRSQVQIKSLTLCANDGLPEYGHYNEMVEFDYNDDLQEVPEEGGLSDEGEADAVQQESGSADLADTSDNLETGVEDVIHHNSVGDDNEEDEEEEEEEEVEEDEDSTEEYDPNQPNVRIGTNHKTNTIGACETLLEGRQSLDELRLQGWNSLSRSRNRAKYDDFEERIFSALLRNGIKSSFQMPVHIARLSLDGLNLIHVPKYMTAIEYSRLESLIIIDCAGTKDFFQALKKPENRPLRLKTLVCELGELGVMYDEDDEDDEDGQEEEVSILDNLIAKQTRLEYLHIEVTHPTRLPNLRKILKNADTLQHFRVFSRALSSLHVYTSEGIEELASKCVKLRQLAIELPYHDSTEDMARRKGWRWDRGFTDCIIAIGKSPHLEVLNLGKFWATSQLPRPMFGMGMPFYPGGSNICYQNWYFSHEIQDLAQNLFGGRIKDFGPRMEKNIQYFPALQVVSALHDPFLSSSQNHQVTFMRGWRLIRRGRLICERFRWIGRR